MATDTDKAGEQAAQLMLALLLLSLSLSLALATGAINVVYRSYARSGSQPLLRAAALGYAVSLVVALFIGLGLAAWPLAGLLAASTSVLFVGTAWLLDAIFTAQATRELEADGLTAILGRALHEE